MSEFSSTTSFSHRRSSSKLKENKLTLSGSLPRLSPTVKQIAKDMHSLVHSKSSSRVGSPQLALPEAIYSKVEAAILAAKRPFDIEDSEVINVNGITGLLSNKLEIEQWKGPVPVTEYPLNEDPEPELIKKKTDQTVVYDQEVSIRYLRPPTPPPPGELIIQHERPIQPPPAPPLIIRQQPMRPETPAPLIIREEPPKPPRPLEPKVIVIPGKQLPPPPRKVVIERFGPLPKKPQKIIIERWLPYKEQKRKIIYQKASDPETVNYQRPKNVVIEWEAPKVVVKREFKDLGIIRTNPLDYQQKYGAELTPSESLPTLAKTIQAPLGHYFASEVQQAQIQLEGDIDALKLIDLDANGLSEYRYLLEKAI